MSRALDLAYTLSPYFGGNHFPHPFPFFAYAVLCLDLCSEQALTSYTRKRMYRLLTNVKETLIRRYLLSEKKQSSHIFQFTYSFLCVANGRGRWLFLLAFSKETRDMFVSAYVLAARFKRKRRTRARTRVPLYTVFPAITYSYVDTNVVGVPSGEPVCRFPMFTNTHVY